MQNIDLLGLRCNEAIYSGNEENINSLIQEIQNELKSDNSDDELCHIQCYLHYYLANLHDALHHVLKEEAAGWRNNKHPENLTAEINHLRIANSLISKLTAFLRDEIRTNLANALSHQRRNIEAFDYWQCDFNKEGDSSFVSAFSKSNELKWISFWLNDPSHANLYRVESYFLLKELQKNIAKTNHPNITNSMANDERIVSFIKYGDKEFKSMRDWQNDIKQRSYANDEKEYRKWCLSNKLFLNPINDITQEWVADRDILQFPDHFLSFEVEEPYFSAFFSVLKRDFCFARFMAYEGIHKMHPIYESEQLFLVNVPENVVYDGYVEKMKTAFRTCFSIFDSIAFLLHAYFQTNSSNHSSFTSKWIQDNLKNTEGNHFIDALYWLACDLTDNDKLTSNNNRWKAPSPFFAEMRTIRNKMEHGWLRVVTEEKTKNKSQHDFSYSVTLDEIQTQTLLTLKLVRSAMLYLCMAVSYEESQRHKDSNKSSISITTPVIEDDMFKLND